MVIFGENKKIFIYQSLYWKKTPIRSDKTQLLIQNINFKFSKTTNSVTKYQNKNLTIQLMF